MDVIKPTKEKRKRKAGKKREKTDEKRNLKKDGDSTGIEIPLFSGERRGSERRESINEELG